MDSWHDVEFVASSKWFGLEITCGVSSPVCAERIEVALWWCSAGCALRKAAVLAV